jgi:hypothetical protein
VVLVGYFFSFSFPSLSLSQECFVGEHLIVFPFALVVLLCYLIGFPLWLLRKLLRNQSALYEENLLYRYGYAYDSFKSDYWYSGVLWIATLFLQGMAFALPPIPAFLASVIPFLGYLIYIISKRPFKKRYLNFFGTFLLIFAIFVRIFIFSDASADVFFVAGTILVLFACLLVFLVPQSSSPPSLVH